jgi:hypothetical protein
VTTQSRFPQTNFGLHRFGSRLDRYTRRRFLGGAGAALMLGLPALDVLRARPVGAQAEAPPNRLVCVGNGNGVPMDEFIPATVGADYALPPLLKTFAPIRNMLSIFTGLGIDEGDHDPGDHGAGVPAMFTCAKPVPTHANTNEQDYKDPGAAFGLGISLDQVMAQHIATQPGATRIPSLQLGLREGQPLGDGPFSPVYLKNLSWKSATEPLSPIVDPGAVFNQLFAGFDPKATAAENARRLGRSISVLDYVADERDYLMPALSMADQQRMDQYFTAAREVEMRLKVAQGEVGMAACDPGTSPGSGLGYAETMKAMADLTVLALQCDATRVVMLHMGCYRNDNHYGFLNASDNHHSLSHAADWAAPDSDYRIVSRWLMDQAGYLFNKMNEVVEPDGTLLQNSLGVYNNDCGEGDSHDHLNLPVFVVGGARGKILTGQHFKYPSNTPCDALYTAVLNALGVPATGFGAKQTAPLPLLV